VALFLLGGPEGCAVGARFFLFTPLFFLGMTALRFFLTGKFNRFCVPSVDGGAEVENARVGEGFFLMGSPALLFCLVLATFALLAFALLALALLALALLALALLALALLALALLALALLASFAFFDFFLGLTGLISTGSRCCTQNSS
jgi:hypothetical protein